MNEEQQQLRRAGTRIRRGIGIVAACACCMAALIGPQTAQAATRINVGTGGFISATAGDGPRITKVRILNEAPYLEVYWNEYVDETAAVNPANFVLKNGDTTIKLKAKGNDYTDTLYFDKGNKELAATDANVMSQIDPDLHMSSIGYEGKIDDSKPLTLEVKGSAIKDASGKAAADATYAGVPMMNFYTKFLASKSGITIKADDTVSDKAMEAAAAQVDIELGKSDNGIAAKMKENHASLAIYSPQENVYILPEHRGGFSKTMYAVEGYGGSMYNNAVSSIAERNILRIRESADGRTTKYPNENILIHEFGHAVKLVGMDQLADKTLSNEFQRLYQSRKDSGMWPNTYAIKNSDEFFATMAAIWFNVMQEKPDWTDGVRSPVNTRSDLKIYDPETYAFFARIFPASDLPSPWAPKDMPKNEYVPAPFAPKPVEEPRHDFATDTFRISLMSGGTEYNLERYDGVCLWWNYGAADVHSWKIAKITDADGEYQVLAKDGRSALAAGPDNTVTIAKTPTSRDTAQQWRFLDAPGDRNGRALLVNVVSGKALAVDGEAKDGAKLILVNVASADAAKVTVTNETQNGRFYPDTFVPDSTDGTVELSNRAGPQVSKVRVVKEGTFLEVYWNEYVDEKAAVNPENFTLKNGGETIRLKSKPSSGVTDTLYFDQKNKEISATSANSMKYLDPTLHMSSIAYDGKIDDSKPLTLQIKGSAIKDAEGRAAQDATYETVPRVSFYTQKITSKTGIVIKADDTVARNTMEAAATQVDIELGKTGTGIAKEMVRNGNSLAIYSSHENVYLIPEQRYAFNKDMYDVEGYGGYPGDGFVSSISEKNVLRTRGNADPAKNTAYTNENILIHEFGHAIKLGGLDTMADQTLANRFYAAYAHAKKTGLWANTYAYQNSDEFFATMAAIWFNVMSESGNGGYDGVRGPINTRDEMRQYDPMTYKVYAELFPAVSLPAPWDSVPNRFGVDMGRTSPPKVDAAETKNADFATDMFQLVSAHTDDRGETYLLERSVTAAGGGQLDLYTLWGAANDLQDSMYSWKVVRHGDVYAFQSVGGKTTLGLTADANGRVSVAGHVFDAKNPAQQWKWTANTDTDDPYDGYLVNVKYGKALTTPGTQYNGSTLVLKPIRKNTMTWRLRDVTQSRNAKNVDGLYVRPAEVSVSPGGSAPGTNPTGRTADSGTKTGDGTGATSASFGTQSGDTGRKGGLTAFGGLARTGVALEVIAGVAVLLIVGVAIIIVRRLRISE
ncbi:MULTISPECIES: anthrax toxin lethal factor-related metalloendopeptidase [Bifidobacterium]|nr:MULTISPECIES: RICIN domain-containing protein [Bifidobacterium]